LHILFLSYFYPPNGSVGGMRGHHLSVGLARRGHTVDVVAAQAPRAQCDPSRFDDALPDGLQVHRCRVAAALVDKVGRRVAGRTAAGDVARNDRDTSRTGEVRQALLRVLRSDFTPEPQAIWNPEALALALRLARVRRPDVVLCSGRPFSSFWVAAAVSRALDCPLVLDLRDPWSLLEHNTGLLRSYVRAREAPLLAAAAGVIVNTAACADAYIAAYGPDIAAKIACIPNGIGDAGPPQPLVPGTPALRLLHGGNIYRRSITPLLTAIERLTPGPDAPGCAFRQVGNIDADTYDAALLARLGDGAQLHPRVPFEQLRAHVSWSTVSVVLLGPDHHLRIPAKFYECLANGRPILFLGPVDHEVVAVLEELGIGAGADSSDADAIAAALVRIRDEILPRLRTHPLSPESLDPFRFERRCEELAHLLESVAAPGVNAPTLQSPQPAVTPPLEKIRLGLGRALALVQRHVFGIPPELPLPVSRT
jgi:hypothetical protein